LMMIYKKTSIGSSLNKPNVLTLGYDFDKWHNYGIKEPITTDISPASNSHMIICGMSGGGKSYAEIGYIAKMMLAQSSENNKDILPKIWFSDFKGDDTFAFLRNCKRYKSYKNTLENLDIVYERFCARLSGGEKSRNPIILVWDEYMSNILALHGEDRDKKTNERIAPIAMNKVSEILMMGRSMSVRLLMSTQRPDAIAFPVGSRLNYGIVIILGAYVRSIYEMLMPDHIDQIKGKQFERGEGVALLQGSELHFIKIPMYKDYERVKEICIQALS